MRPPRIRLTIGRTLMLVLSTGIMLWIVLVYWPGLRERTIAEQIAEAKYKQARLVREVAELALVEFERGVDRENASALQGEAALARSDVERAVDRLKWSDAMRAKGYVSNAQRKADGLAVDRAGFDIDQVRDRIETFADSAGKKKVAKGKPTVGLDADVAKARADELTKLETYRLEQQRRRSWRGF